MDTKEIEQTTFFVRNWKIICGIYADDELTRASFPHRPCGSVCNTQPLDAPGEHWVANWLEQNGTAEYFDSFAQPPDHEMEYFLKRHAPGGWERNHRSLQNVFTTVWGGDVILYLYGRNVKRHWSMRILKKNFALFVTVGKRISECRSWCGKCSDTQFLYLTFIP